MTGERAAGANVDYLPADFLGWERYARIAQPRVVATAVAPMDERGFFSLALHAGATFGAFMAATCDRERLAIVEVVRDLPQVFGLDQHGGHRVHVSEVDCVIESDRSAYVLPDARSPTRTRRSRGTLSGWSRTARRCSSASAPSPTASRSSSPPGPRATSASTPRCWSTASCCCTRLARSPITRASSTASRKVTTPRHHVQFVVTEHGVASLGMLTARERTDALIAIAHPDFRAALRAATHR